MAKKNKKTKKQKIKSRKRGHKVRQIQRRALILVDNRPIRRKAIAKCKNILTNYYKVKDTICYYEETDRPAYEKWLNSTFGVELTTLRDLKKENYELEEFIDLVHFLKSGKRISFHQAYILAKELEKDPEKFKEECDKIRKKMSWFSPFDDDFSDDDFVDDDFDDDDFENIPGDEDIEEEEDDDYENPFDGDFDLKEEDIEEEFNRILSTHPYYEKILNNSELYEKFFKEFKRAFFSGWEEGQTEFDDDDDDKILGDAKKRLKNLFRSLAFKLHPDNNDHDPIKLELWYQVQEAYARQNLEKLEKLYALHSFHEGGFSKDCPVSHILDLHIDYKTHLKILRRILRNYEKEVAWNFSKRKDKDAFYSSIQKTFSIAIEEERMQNEYFNKILKNWSEPPEPKIKELTRKKKEFTPPPEQMELPF